MAGIGSGIQYVDILHLRSPPVLYFIVHSLSPFLKFSVPVIWGTLEMVIEIPALPNCIIIQQ